MFSPPSPGSGVELADDGQHLVGVAGDLRHRGVQPRVAAAHLHRQLFQALEPGAQGGLPPRVAEAGFHIGQGRLAVLDRIAHALAGDAVVFGDLGQRKVLVIVFGQDGALFIGQDGAVIVKQHRKPEVFLVPGGHVIITFNDDLTDFTMENITSLRLNGFHAKNALGMKGWIYSGPKYGITVQGNDYAFKPLKINLQKRLFSSESSSYISDYKDFLQKGGAVTFNYYMYLQSSQGLIAYVPSIPIFLGGYFEVIQNPIAVNLQPNTNNYIYLERDSSTKKLKAYASTTKDIEEGSKQFSRILLARILTNEANPIETEYYRINTGYNDYTFRKTVKVTQPEHGKIYVNDKIGTEFKFELGTDVTIKAVADNGYVVNYLDVSNGNTGGGDT